MGGLEVAAYAGVASLLSTEAIVERVIESAAYCGGRYIYNRIVYVSFCIKLNCSIPSYKYVG